MKKKINRSSKTGKIVTDEFAESHPATTETEVVEVKIGKIDELTVDFGRADLNEIVAKLNEVIRKSNQ